MVLALLFFGCVSCAGFGILRIFGQPKGPLALGLAPALGLATLAIVESWVIDVNLPPPVPGLVLLVVCGAGAGAALHERGTLVSAARSLFQEQRLATSLCLTALLVTCVVMAIAFAGVQVPLSPHDGAYHAQVIQAHRTGAPWSDWYPQGLAAVFAAALQLVPWVDSAEGAFSLGESLPFLAVLAVFGLGIAIWRDLLIASAASLFLSLTYIYPYFPQLWSGWPMAASLVLVIGLWSIGREYLRGGTWQLAIEAGLLVGAIVLVHGTELYTVALILLVVLLSSFQRVAWPALSRHVGLAISCAFLTAAAYLPTLLHWAGTGGAYSVGMEDAWIPPVASDTPTDLPLFAVFGLDALGVDLPIRLLFLVVGIVCACRARTGRSLIAIGLIFTAVTAIFTYLNPVPAIRQLFAATYPWGMQFRIFMVVAVVQALLAGAGSIALLQYVSHWLARRGDPRRASTRRIRRAVRLVALTWLGLASAGMTVLVAQPTQQVIGFTTDDAAAMTWLRQNAPPEAVVANDGFADAGIWVPNKAGLQIVLPRELVTHDETARWLVLDNVDRLDQVPGAASEACALNVEYVYRGSKDSQWDARRFPPLSDLEAAPGLEEVFRRGGAAVFKLRNVCRG